MKNIKLHAIILALIIVSELIGTHTLKLGAADALCAAFGYFDYT